MKKHQQIEIDLLKTRRNRGEVILGRTRHFDAYIKIREFSEAHPEYPIRIMCEILNINRAAYYKWKNRTNRSNDNLNELLAEKVVEIHNEHPDMGYRRIRDTLEHDHDIKVNDKRVLHVCRKKKVQSYIKHRYNCCTKPASDPAYIADNILNREFQSNKQMNSKFPSYRLQQPTRKPISSYPQYYSVQALNNRIELFTIIDVVKEQRG